MRMPRETGGFGIALPTFAAGAGRAGLASLRSRIRASSAACSVIACWRFDEVLRSFVSGLASAFDVVTDAGCAGATDGLAGALATIAVEEGLKGVFDATERKVFQSASLPPCE